MDNNSYDDINSFISLSVNQDLLLRQVSATLLEIEGVLGAHRKVEKNINASGQPKSNKKKTRKKWLFFRS